MAVFHWANSICNNDYQGLEHEFCSAADELGLLYHPSALEVALLIVEAILLFTPLKVPVGAAAVDAALPAARSALGEAVESAAAAPATRAGMPFTPAGRRSVIREATDETGGIYCDYCNRPVEAGASSRVNRLEVDHVVPRAKGGEGAPHNGAPSCGACNMAKSDGDLFDFGWEYGMAIWIDDMMVWVPRTIR